MNWRVFCPPNRIKDAQETVSGSQTWKQTFVYDRYGNRNFDAANTTTISGCPANQCNPTIDVANNRFTNGQGYSYDLSGNVINDAEGRTFIYDGENKQKEVKNSSNITVGTYFYDGDGKRIKKVTASEEIVFVYDAGGKLVAEYSSLTPQTTPTTRYLTSDHLGSPRIITDGSGAVLSRRDFAPFGEELYTGTGNRQTGHGYSYGDSTSQKFTSYERDNETELDFAEARMHNYNLGRFTSPDPYKIVVESKLEKDEEKAKLKLDSYLSQPQQWNRYTYVINNPLKIVDPTGKVIHLLGKTEEERQQELQRIKDIVGEKAAQYLQTSADGKTVFIKKGSFEHFAFLTSFDGSKDKSISRIMGSILVSSKIVEFGVAKTYTLKTGAKTVFGYDETRTFDVARDNKGGVTIKANASPSGNVRIYVHPDAALKGTLWAPRGKPELSSDGERLTFANNSIVDGHEFGHAYDELYGKEGNWRSIENALRKKHNVKQMREAHH
ncbi:MAG: RHS repeat domain-containing protein [Aridibacter sp.]